MGMKLIGVVKYGVVFDIAILICPISQKRLKYDEQQFAIGRWQSNVELAHRQQGVHLTVTRHVSS